MKILVINPPWEVTKGYGARSNCRWPHIEKISFSHFPIYLGYTVALLEKYNLKVEMIDSAPLMETQSHFLKRVKEKSPDLCFIETSTPTINQDLENTRLIKEQTGAKVYLMGPHASVFHKELLEEYNYLDGVIRGEFEYTVLDIALGKNFEDIDGLSYIDTSNNIRVNKKRLLIENLDDLPFPAWDKFELKFYDWALLPSPSYLMITSRGCPFHCTYCLWPQVMYGHKQRFRSAENVCDEIGLLIDKGVRGIRFDDDTFALNKNHVLSICNEMIKRGYHKKVQWSCFGHISLKEKEVYQKMYEAGCVQIDFGVESHSQTVLNSIKKGVKADDIKGVVEMCKRIGLKVYCTYMLGFPQETKEDIEKSIRDSLDIDCDYMQVSYAMPYPGTEMYQKGLEKGYLRFPTTWERFANCEPAIKNDHISIEELEKLRKKFYRKFYFRPKYVILFFKKLLQSPKDFIKAINSVAYVLRHSF